VTQTGVRPFARVDQILRHVPELQIEVLRGATQDVERLVGRQVLPFHQDPLGLSDHLAGGQRGVQVGGPALVVLMGPDRRVGQSGHARQ
jgi:hypothetical protein